MSLRDRVLLLVLLGAFPGPAAEAQSYSDPGLGIGVNFNGSKGIDAAGLGFSGGVQARLRLTGGLGLELLATYRSEKQESGGVPVLQVREIPIQGSLLFFILPSGRVQPYVVAGFGYYRTWSFGIGPNEATGTTHENNFGLHAGLGVDVRTGLRTAVFADARYVFLDVDAVKNLVPPNSANFVQVTAGLNVYF
jgi:outer membrane protein W